MDYCCGSCNDRFRRRTKQPLDRSRRVTTTAHSKIWKPNGEERVFSTALAVVSDYVLDFCLKRDFDDGSCSKTNEGFLTMINGGTV